MLKKRFYIVSTCRDCDQQWRMLRMLKGSEAFANGIYVDWPDVDWLFSRKFLFSKILVNISRGARVSLILVGFCFFCPALLFFANIMVWLPFSSSSPSFISNLYCPMGGKSVVAFCMWRCIVTGACQQIIFMNQAAHLTVYCSQACMYTM